MKKRIFSILIAAMFITTMFAGCSKGSDKSDSSSDTTADKDAQTAVTEAAAATGKDVKDITVGALMKDNSDTFVKKISDAMQAHADELGVKLIMCDAEGDVNQQIEQCENLITQKVDAIILNAQDMEGSNPCIVAANEAGIPIVSCNCDTSNTDYQAFVGCKDEESGVIEANYVLDNLKEGSGICIIEGPMGQAGQVGRLAGYVKQGLIGKDGNSDGKYKLLAKQTANWKREEAMALTEDWLTTYGKKLNAIVCENDDMAMGALSACQASGRTDILITGVDAITDALTAVKNGEMGCTVFQDAAGQGTTALDVSIAFAQGKTINDLKDVVPEGATLTVETKDIRIPFQLVTKDNVDEYMK